jgi:membrane protease YdiL (CAAX protease family)
MTGLVYQRAGFGELLSRLRRWRVGAGWYLIAVLAAPALMTGTVLLLSQFSPVFVPGIVTSSDKVTLLVSGLVAGILVGIFEELGWTGFAIPRLRLSYGVLATGLIVGFVWGLWHMPLFTESARASQSVSPFLNLAVMLFSFLPAFRVLMVWVYDRTGSLLVAMLMHASQTATTLIFAIRQRTLRVVCNLVYAAALWTFVAVVQRQQTLSRQARGAY